MRSLAGYSWTWTTYRNATDSNLHIPHAQPTWWLSSFVECFTFPTVLLGSHQLMSDQLEPNTRSLISSAHLNLVNAWRHQQDAERKRQRLGRIRLPTLWFRVTWVVFFVMRVTVFFFLSALSVGYWFVSSPILKNTRDAYNLPGSNSLLGISGVIGVGAAVYVYQLAGMVQISIKQGRLAFKPRQQTAPNIMQKKARGRGPLSVLHAVLFYCSVVYREIFGPKGLLGIEHPYFLQILMAREIMEIASQGYQAYTSSTMVPRRWINNLATTLLVVNCWSTLLVQAFVPKSLTVQRVLCLAIDTVLDFGWTVVIPVCILLPYLVAYDPKLRAYPDKLLADYSWQLSWQMDIQQLCITSVLDFISNMLPCVSMLTSSRTISGVLDEKRTLIQPERFLPPLSKREAFRQIEAAGSLASAGITQAASRASPPASTSRVWALFYSPRLPRQNRTRTRTSTTSRLSRRNRFWPKINSHFLFFFLLGVGVICVHLYATSVATRAGADVGCMVPMRPWFTQSYACAYTNIKCRAGRSGDPSDQTAISDGDEIEQRLSAFEPSALKYLVISHCAALKMPAIVQGFHSLQIVEVFNSTILEWQEAAAFTTHSHPYLRRFGLVRTNMSAFPDALARDAPFVFMSLVATNLTTLPDSILSNWKALQYFTMEHGQLREIPRAIAAMEGLERLSVCDNRIDTLPETLSGAYSVLNLARNPLRALPRTLRDASRLRSVTFEHTQVVDVPSWLTGAMAARASSLSVFGIGSPFCEHASTSPSNNTSGVTCLTPSRFVDGHYLLALISQILLASP